MNKIFSFVLPKGSCAAFTAVALLAGMVSTSDAAWPRYRVTAGYSLPTAPYQRPNWVPVYPPSPYLPNAPVAPATAPPMAPAPGYYGNVPAANMQPSLYAPPQSAPNTSYYSPPFSPPGYNQPVYNSVPYNQAPFNASPYNPGQVNSFYSPQVPMVQPNQQPLPIPNAYGQPMQPAGGFYQPTRPSTFYSPVPSYYPQPSTFGRY